MTAVASYEEFERLARARGFDTVLVREWDANVVVDTHTHPFSVWAQIARGELWLSHDGMTRHLRTGDQFELAAEVPHAERYGTEGASYWVARKDA